MMDEEQQKRLMEMCRISVALLEKNTTMLKEGEEKLLAVTELLRQSTEDIATLMAFIKARELPAPKIETTAWLN